MGPDLEEHFWLQKWIFLDLQGTQSSDQDKRKGHFLEDEPIEKSLGFCPFRFCEFYGVDLESFTLIKGTELSFNELHSMLTQLISDQTAASGSTIHLMAPGTCVDPDRVWPVWEPVLFEPIWPNSNGFKNWSIFETERF